MPFDPLQLLLEMEAEMIDNMTALLASGAVASAEWQAGKLAEVGALRQMNQATVEKYLTEIQDNLYDYYVQAGTDSVLGANIPGLSDVLPEGVSSTLAMTWKIWETQTMNQLKDLGMTLIDGAQTTYINIVYKSAAKMLIGDTTLREAVAETATGWLDAGLKGLTSTRRLADGSVVEVNWSLEGYAQMVLRSNERMMLTATQNQAFDKYDVDLVEISSHLGARELCAPYQGKVFSRSGRSSQFPALSSTSYGQIAGLFGINCGHSMYAYNPSVGKTFDTYKKAENGQAYADSQTQRRLEREIRAAKREQSAAGIDPGGDAAKRAGAKVRQAQANMRDFIDETDRTRHYDREKIYK
jgi:hypothetical protein